MTFLWSGPTLTSQTVQYGISVIRTNFKFPNSAISNFCDPDHCHLPKHLQYGISVIQTNFNYPDSAIWYFYDWNQFQLPRHLHYGISWIQTNFNYPRTWNMEFLWSRPTSTNKTPAIWHFCDSHHLQQPRKCNLAFMWSRPTSTTQALAIWHSTIQTNFR